eukprot:4965123-Prymnesium_polylepis.1
MIRDVRIVEGADDTLLSVRQLWILYSSTGTAGSAKATRCPLWNQSTSIPSPSANALASMTGP